MHGITLTRLTNGAMSTFISTRKRGTTFVSLNRTGEDRQQMREKRSSQRCDLQPSRQQDFDVTTYLNTIPGRPGHAAAKYLQ